MESLVSELELGKLAASTLSGFEQRLLSDDIKVHTDCVLQFKEAFCRAKINQTGEKGPSIRLIAAN